MSQTTLIVSPSAGSKYIAEIKQQSTWRSDSSGYVPLSERIPKSTKDYPVQYSSPGRSTVSACVLATVKRLP